MEKQGAINNLVLYPWNSSFWRGWTQEKISETAGATRGRVAQIVNNTNFSEINTLLSHGHDMDYIGRHYHKILSKTGGEVTHLSACGTHRQVE